MTSFPNSISSAIVTQLIEGARIAGLDINTLLNRNGIEAQILDTPTNHIDIESYVQLCRNISHIMNDETYGLLAKPLPLGTYNAVTTYAFHSQTLGQALKRYVQFYNLFGNSLHGTLETDAGRVDIRVTRDTNQPIRNNSIIEYSLLCMHRFISWLANERIVLMQIVLDYPPPSHSEELKQLFFNTPILFNQKFSGIQFDSRYLQHPIVQNQYSLREYQQHAPAGLYLSLHASGHMTLQVQNLLRQGFNKMESWGLADIATQLELNSQTLSRYLKQEGTSFNSIKNQIKRDIAIHYLDQSELSVDKIAYKVGYSEASVFIRAFKKWTGFTPLKFREKLRL